MLMWHPSLRGNEGLGLVNAPGQKEQQKSEAESFVSKLHNWNGNWCVSPWPTI